MADEPGTRSNGRGAVLGSVRPVPNSAAPAPNSAAPVPSSAAPVSGDGESETGGRGPGWRRTLPARAVHGLRVWLYEVVEPETLRLLGAWAGTAISSLRSLLELPEEMVLDAVDRVLDIGRVTPESVDGLRRVLVAADVALRVAPDGTRLIGLTTPEPRAPYGPRGADVERFHPWVGEAAGSLWAAGYGRLAVLEAAKRIAAETRTKLGLAQPSTGFRHGPGSPRTRHHQGEHISYTRLMSRAFPYPLDYADGPYLTVAGASGARDALDGPGLAVPDEHAIHAFAIACFAALRNPAAHELPDWDEQATAEYLAALSALARWVDHAVVVSPPPGGPAGAGAAGSGAAGEGAAGSGAAEARSAGFGAARFGSARSGSARSGSGRRADHSEGR